MSSQTKEGRIFLAIEAIRTNKKMSIRRAAKAYDVPEASLRHRLNGRVAKREKRNGRYQLTSTEEDTIVQHTLDLDERGFPPRIEGVEDMANLLLETRRAKRVGKNWAYRFVRRRPELKTRFSRAYDFQRALCEDPDLIKKWFELVKNMRAKYGIQDEDLYNFDETGFMMGVICPAMVVTRADRRGRSKQLQAGNREWATAIECVSSDGFVVPPFLIVQGKNHLASWYEGTNIPDTWMVKPSPNGWTDNETAMDWIKHFNKHTVVRRKGAWRMIVLDGHESHVSAAFDNYCLEHNIITICLPAHSSHLTQPLDVGCFSVLKRLYGRQLEIFIRAHINHIMKPEFFIAFVATHNATMTCENVKAGFRGAGLVPYDPEAVLSKVDVKLRTPTPTGPPAEGSPWVSQTPHTAAEALSQSQLVRGRIDNHQGSSPTTLFQAVKQLAKGTEAIAYEMTLLRSDLKATQEANKALAKRRRAKRTRLQDGGTLTAEAARVLIAEKESGGRKRGQEVEEVGPSGARPATVRCCGRCAKPGHNVRTCPIAPESSGEDSDMDSD
jgi:hypothetical protein